MKWLRLKDCNGRDSIIDLDRVTCCYVSYENDNHTVFEMNGREPMFMDITIDDVFEALRSKTGGTIDYE